MESFKQYLAKIAETGGDARFNRRSPTVVKTDYKTVFKMLQDMGNSVRSRAVSETLVQQRPYIGRARQIQIMGTYLTSAADAIEKAKSYISALKRKGYNSAELVASYHIDQSWYARRHDHIPYSPAILVLVPKT